MRTVCFTFLLVLIVAGISTGAQDSEGWICIQGDSGGALLVFNSKTGDYKFVRCKDGAALSGTGQIRADGCQIVLEDTRPTHSVSASVNTCVQQGKGSVEVPKDFSPDGINIVPAMKESFGDINLGDNSCSCGRSEGVTPANDDRSITGSSGAASRTPQITGSDPEFIGPPESEGGSKEIIVKSDAGDAFIVFNSATGDYKFTRCDGIAFSGTGQIKHDGCFTFLEDRRELFTVFVAVNICAQAGKFNVDVPKAFSMEDGSIVPEMHVGYGDSDLTDSVAGCSGK